MTSGAEGERPLILFDGVCNLCTGSVRFVIERDAGKQFRFASLQSPLAAKLIGAPTLESVVLVLDGRVYRKSTAALLIARRLGGLWPLAAALLVIPRPRPQGDLAERFLD